MAFEPFSIDISLDPNGEPTSIMVHVRAETSDKWAQNLRAAGEINPAVGRALAALGGVGATISERIAANDRAVAHERHTAAQAQRQQPTPITTAKPAPTQEEPVPTCPTHGTSKWSKFNGGLYCPKKQGDAYCGWKHDCSAACTHAAAA
ncbi:MAG: hypothetical protein IVW53_14645 [Chloroflexi bacterium]|nr:hypothetical protein [Chloroflexota bacterium]